MYYDILESDFGKLHILADDTYLLAVSFFNFDYPLKANAITQMTKKQLKEYLNKERFSFDLPLNIQASEFQNLVYQEMQKIEYGQRLTYGQLAQASGSSKAARAVGSACAKNKYLIIVPCHRVVKSDGSIGNYAYGGQIKKDLLDFESK